MRGGPGCAAHPAHHSPSSTELSSWGLQSETPWWTSIDPGLVLTPQVGSQALRYSPGATEPTCLPK